MLMGYMSQVVLGKKGDRKWEKGEPLFCASSWDACSKMEVLSIKLEVEVEFLSLWHQKVTHQPPVQSQLWSRWTQPVLTCLNWAGADFSF